MNRDNRISLMLLGGAVLFLCLLLLPFMPWTCTQSGEDALESLRYDMGVTAWCRFGGAKSAIEQFTLPGGIRDVAATRTSVGPNGIHWYRFAAEQADIAMLVPALGVTKHGKIAVYAGGEYIDATPGDLVLQATTQEGNDTLPRPHAVFALTEYESQPDWWTHEALRGADGYLIMTGEATGGCALLLYQPAARTGYYLRTTG